MAFRWTTDYQEVAGNEFLGRGFASDAQVVLLLLFGFSSQGSMAAKEQMVGDLAQTCGNLLQRNVVPDWLVRYGIRRQLHQRLQQEASQNPEKEIRRKMQMIEMMRLSAIAIHQQTANEQHYELPTEFFELHLGKRLKYSCAFYPTAETTLEEAEDHMLRLYCERAGLRDGMTVLDLGCGWGSLTLYMAEHYPNCEITALSNSWTQRQRIETQAFANRMHNVKVLTADITAADSICNGKKFDRIISIEMFEHMRNYSSLLNKIASWLKNDGRLFTHTFCHDKFIYTMETHGTGTTNWLGRHFFTGGIMISDDVFSYFQDDLRLTDRWRVDGRHYAQTAEHWLQNFDRNIVKIRPILRSIYAADATKWEAYWRTFYLAVAELFAYNNGKEWYVSHCLFEKR